MASNRRALGAASASGATNHPLQWVAAFVVPAVAGGIVGRRLGGVVTSSLIIPWLDHLLRLDRPATNAPGPASLRTRTNVPVAEAERRAEPLTPSARAA